MNTYVIIPARYGSTRFPGKPLVELMGKPLLRWVFEGASKAETIKDIYVATDDHRIEKACLAFGAKTIMTGKNHPSGTDRIVEACEKLSLEEDDIVINVQGDEPLVEGLMVDLLAETLLRTPGSPMATLAFKTSSFEEYRNTNVVKVVFDVNWKALYFSRATIPYFRTPPEEDFFFWKHLGYYAYRFNFLKKLASLPQGVMEKQEQLEQLRALENGFEIKVAPSPKDTIAIDTPEDVVRFLQKSKGMT